MTVNLLTISFSVLLEIVSLIVVVRLWRRPTGTFLPRLLWSIVVLVPLFGLLIYVFLHEEPKTHPYSSNWTDFSGGGDGGHGGGGHGGH
jgi:predicted membrane channel-forming protein YqfA (hemolysin III family)